MCIRFIYEVISTVEHPPSKPFVFGQVGPQNDQSKLITHHSPRRPGPISLTPIRIEPITGMNNVKKMMPLKLGLT